MKNNGGCSAAAFAVCAALACATPIFYPVIETFKWSKYYSPVHGNRWGDCARGNEYYWSSPPAVGGWHTIACACSEYFTPGRKINPTALYIGAGMGRTGTTTMYRTLLDLNIDTCHAAVPCAYLPRISYIDGGPQKLQLNDFASLYPMNSTARGLFDVPVGEFVWDLLDAFPNNRVMLTLRPVRHDFSCANERM
jgi:hypothetical protein